MKKIISVTLIILLILCISACDGTTKNTNRNVDTMENFDINSESSKQGTASEYTPSEFDTASKDNQSKQTQNNTSKKEESKSDVSLTNSSVSNESETNKHNESTSNVTSSNIKPSGNKNNVSNIEQSNNNVSSTSSSISDESENNKYDDVINNETSSEIKPSENPDDTTPSKPDNEPVIHKHLYTTSVVTATCSQDGYTLNKCSCGDEYISDTTSKTYRHSFSKNTHPSLGESYVSDSLGRDKCSLCGLEVIDQGYWRDGNYKKSNVRYYFTNDTFVVYGSGTIPGNTITNSSTENLSPWNDYLYDHISGFKNLTKIIIADGITEISNNAFKFPENNIKTIYISDSVKKIKNSFSGFNKVADVRLSRNLEYLGANFSSRDHRLLINKTVLPKTLKYLSRNAFKSSGWLFYEGTEEEFSSMKIIENQDLTVIEWIKKNCEAYLVAISGVTYNCDFQ